MRYAAAFLFLLVVAFAVGVALRAIVPGLEGWMAAAIAIVLTVAMANGVARAKGIKPPFGD